MKTELLWSSKKFSRILTQLYNIPATPPLKTISINFLLIKPFSSYKKTTANWVLIFIYSIKT